MKKARKNNERDTDEYRAFREIVLKRDGRKCQMPGCGSRRRLQVHHIMRYADSLYGRLNPDNAITLCFVCHKFITGSEHNYAILFNSIAIDNSTKKKKKKK